jgi:hypothetical protein
MMQSVVIEGMKSMIKKITALVMAVALLGGCGAEPDATQPAPLGDKAALEKLAASWEKISSNKLSVSPASLPGNERKKFLEQVFADAGYSYTATLKQVAVQNIDKGNKLHTDLVDLVLLPHHGPRTPMDPAEIYTVEELQAVAAVERNLTKP